MQFRGRVDDLLVLGRVLSSDEIAAIASHGVKASLGPEDGQMAIFYDFESPDAGTTITDRFTRGDDAQNGIVRGNGAVRDRVQVDANRESARFGHQSARIGVDPALAVK